MKLKELKCLNCGQPHPRKTGDYISWDCPKCGWTNKEGEFPPGDFDPITFKRRYIDETLCLVSYPPITKTDLRYMPEKQREAIILFLEKGGDALTKGQRDNIRHNLFKKNAAAYEIRSRKLAAKARIIRFLKKTDTSSLFPKTE